MREQAIAGEAQAPWKDAPPDPRYQNKKKNERARIKRLAAERSLELKYAPPIKELREVLADGLWHRKFRIDRIAQKYDVKPQTIIDRAGAGLSESGVWICLPQTHTPPNAPDETPSLTGK